MRADDPNTRILVELWNVGDIARRSVVQQLDKRAVCTLKQFLVMDVIARSVGNVGPSTLAAKLGCSRPNVAQLLGELTRRALAMVLRALAGFRTRL